MQYPCCGSEVEDMQTLLYAPPSDQAKQYYGDKISHRGEGSFSPWWEKGYQQINAYVPAG